MPRSFKRKTNKTTDVTRVSSREIEYVLNCENDFQSFKIIFSVNVQCEPANHNSRVTMEYGSHQQKYDTMETHWMAISSRLRLSYHCRVPRPLRNSSTMSCRSSFYVLPSSKELQMALRLGLWILDRRKGITRDRKDDDLVRTIQTRQIPILLTINNC